VKRCVVSVIAAVLLTGGCSHAEAGPAKPSASAKPQKALAAGPVKLWKGWQRKADATGKEGAPNVCKDAGAAKCATYLSAIVTTETTLEDEISAAHAEAEYKTTMPELAKMDAAYEQYADAGCEGNPFANDADACAGASATLVFGLATLGMTMQTDEIKAGVD
jgi:hypothetical protein